MMSSSLLQVLPKTANIFPAQVVPSEATRFRMETRGKSSVSRFSRRESCTVYHHDRCRHAPNHTHQRMAPTLTSGSNLGPQGQTRRDGLIPEAGTLGRRVGIRKETPTAKGISPRVIQRSATTRGTRARTPATGVNPTERGAIAGVSPHRRRAEVATIVLRAVTEAAMNRPHVNGLRHMPSHEGGHVRPRRLQPQAMPSPQTCRI